MRQGKIVMVAASAIALTTIACSTNQYGGSILSDYKSYESHRSGAHTGIDYNARNGTPIIAAADGDVVSVVSAARGCGEGVILYHLSGLKFTVYCHMERVAVATAQSVKRGDVIGYVGMSGNAGIPHLHFEVSNAPHDHGDGNLGGTEDPKTYLRGCFDPAKTYPKDEFVLTNPLRCG